MCNHPFLFQCQNPMRTVINSRKIWPDDQTNWIVARDVTKSMHLLRTLHRYISLSLRKHTRFLRKNLRIRSKLSLHFYSRRWRAYTISSIKITLGLFFITRDNCSWRMIRKFIKYCILRMVHGWYGSLDKKPGPGKIAPSSATSRIVLLLGRFSYFWRMRQLFPGTSRNSINRSMNYSRGCGDSCLHHLLHNLPFSFTR